MASDRLWNNQGLKKMLVILDANFLMIPHQHNVDIFSELDRLIPDNKPATLSTVVRELEGLSRQNPDSAAAKVALGLIEARAVEIFEAEGDADDSIVGYAAGNPNVCVGTNDRMLKKRLRDKGINTVFLRGKTHLELF
jgi:uncharacterized protein